MPNTCIISLQKLDSRNQKDRSSESLNNQIKNNFKSQWVNYVTYQLQ